MNEMALGIAMSVQGLLLMGIITQEECNQIIYGYLDCGEVQEAMDFLTVRLNAWNAAHARPKSDADDQEV